MLQAAGRKQLRPDADAEERFALSPHRLFKSLDHARDPIEAAPAIGESADAGQHDPLGSQNVLRPGSDVDPVRKSHLARGPLERLSRGMQVARAVIDDCDGHSAPLVDGTRSAWRGSIATAALSARATPLKQDSAIWWLLTP